MTDGCGNTTTVTQTIDIDDTTAPTFTVPPTVTICRNPDGTYDIDPSATGDVDDETDNCSIDQEAVVIDDDYTNLLNPDHTGYIIRTWSLTDNCGNTTQKDQIIWVEPVVTLIATDDTICNGGTTDIPVTSDNTTTNGIRYTWTVTDNADVDGEESSIGNGQLIGTTITQTLTNNSDEAQKIIYNITPWTVDEHGNNRCAGTDLILDIWVEPTARMSVDPKHDTICNGEEVQIDLHSPTVPTQPVRIRYTTEVPGGVNVTPENGTGLFAGSALSNTITNTTDNAQLVKFILTPYTVAAGTGAEKCAGIPDTAYIWVEPTAKITLIPLIDTLCSTEITDIQLNSITNPTLQVLFRYETIKPAGVAVTPGSGTSLVNGTRIYDEIVNTTDTAQLVLFVVTPYTQDNFGAEKCPGIPVTTSIWIEPVPKVSLTPLNDTICTNLTINLQTSSATRSLQDLKLYYETEYNSAFVEVTPAGATSDFDPGFVVTDQIINYSDVPQQVKFIFYPQLKKYDGSMICPGIPDTAIVWVAPRLKILVDTISTYIGGWNIRCFGETSGMIRLRPVGGISAFPGYSDADLNYIWNVDRPSLKEIKDLKSGLYTITINDKLMCSDDSSFTLTQPDVLVNHIKTIHMLSCYGGDGEIGPTTRGGTQEYSYNWDVPIDYKEELKDTLHKIIPGAYTLITTDANGCLHSADTVVSFPPAPAIIALADTSYGKYQVKCNGESNARLVSLNLTGGRVSYEWKRGGIVDTVYTNSKEANFLYNRKEGTYVLTYRDSLGCSGNQTVFISQPMPISIGQSDLSQKAGGYNVSCFNSSDGSINLKSISGGHGSPYTFQWESLNGSILPQSVNQNQDNLGPGQYSVTISDIYNCSVTDTFELTAPDEIVITRVLSESLTGDHNINCFGENTGSISVTATGGIPPVYQYKWNDISLDTNRRDNLPAGSYILTVTDVLGCSEIDTIQITEPGKLIIDSVYHTNYNGYGISCNGLTDGHIFVLPSGGTESYIYKWQRNGSVINESTGRLSDVAAGNYKLTIVDSNNCSLDWSHELTEPPVMSSQMTHTNVNCTGIKLGTANIVVNGGTGKYSYEWDNGVTVASLNNLNPGIYRVTVTDENSCQVIDSTIIVQNTEVLINIEIEKPVSCNGLSDGILRAVAQDGVPPYEYLWENGAKSGERFTSAGSGIYKVSVIDNDGCEGSQTIELNDPDPLSAHFEVYNVSCFGRDDGFVRADASGGNGNYNYYWDGQLLRKNEVDDLYAGKYNLKVIDEMNCETETLVAVTQPAQLRAVVKESGTTRPFCPDWSNGVLSLSVTGGTREYSFVWDASAENDSVISDIREGWYEVSISDAQGCSIDTAFHLRALNDNCLDIPTAFTPNDDDANNYWEIRYMTETGAEVRFGEVYPTGNMKIYDRLGNLVYSCSGGCPEDWNGEDMHGRRLPVDTYYFIIDLNNGNGNDILKGIVTIIR